MTQEPVGAAPAPGTSVAVTYGVYQLQLDLAGRSVAAVRASLAGALNIDPRSLAVVNGQPVDGESVVLRPGDRIEFVRLAGQKGGGPVSKEIPREANPPAPSRCERPPNRAPHAAPPPF